MPWLGLRGVIAVFLIIPRTLYLDRITISWLISVNVVDSDFTITDGVSAVNLTSQNRINSAEIIAYNPFIRNNNSLIHS